MAQNSEKLDSLINIHFGDIKKEKPQLQQELPRADLKDEKWDKLWVDGGGGFGGYYGPTHMNVTGVGMYNPPMHPMGPTNLVGPNSSLFQNPQP